MELLLTIKEKDIFKDCKEQSNIDYKLRIAPRAVLFDNDNKVALLHVAKYDYYKLPGGGKEPSEDLIEALKRECYEECGCNIEVTGEIGQILEYRDRIALKHETYGFLAKVVGEKKEPLFVQDERNSNYKLLWLDLDKAIELVANSK
ncbi:MAG: NUDIX domain-containing protein, partial [bacterium]|nr:NUDIX domain-containing protein [bacterium]